MVKANPFHTGHPLKITFWKMNVDAGGWKRIYLITPTIVRGAQRLHEAKKEN
jgi:hypothetical protein